MYIGKHIQELRKTKKMTLSELAESSGVQIATLSRIENEKMVGTLESHINIAKTLGVDVTQLYSNIAAPRETVAHQAAKDAADTFLHSDKSSYQVLTTNVLSKKMMPILLKVEPGGKSNKEQNKGGTEKFIFVLEGKIEAVIEDKTYPLSRNHSLYFDASKEHYFVNHGKTTAKVICVGTPVAL